MTTVDGEFIEPKAKRVLTRKEQAEEHLMDVTDEIYGESLVVLRSALRFAELNPDDPHECPQEWIEELGEREAKKRHAVAYGAWLNNSKAPAGLKIAQAVAMGIMKTKSNEKIAPQALSVNLITMTAPEALPTVPYKELEVAGD